MNVREIFKQPELSVERYKQALDDVAKASDAQIEALSKACSIEMARRDKERKQKAAELMREIAGMTGLAVQIEKKGERQRKPKEEKPKAKPKYQHPTDKSLTWAGVGSTPKWMQELEAKGNKRSEFLIKESV